MSITYTSDFSLYIESLIDSRAIHFIGSTPYKRNQSNSMWFEIKIIFIRANLRHGNLIEDQQFALQSICHRFCLNRTKGNE